MLYWYKSTKTDTCSQEKKGGFMSTFSLLQATKKQQKKEPEASPGNTELLSLLALLVQRYFSLLQATKKQEEKERAGSFAK